MKTNGLKCAVLGFALAVVGSSFAGLPVPEPGFVPMFNGRDLSGWEGATNTYAVTEEGYLTCLQRDTKGESGSRNLWSAKDYSDFIIRFDVKLPKDANNGLGIRTPPNGWCSHDGMEIQLLDDWGEAWNGAKALYASQYSGAIYGVVPPARKLNGESYINRPGEWNTVEVTAKGPQITVVLNGVTVVDADVSKYSTTAAYLPDRHQHPGLHNKSGRIHWCGHGRELFIRNVRIKEL